MRRQRRRDCRREEWGGNTGNGLGLALPGGEGEEGENDPLLAGTASALGMRMEEMKVRGWQIQRTVRKK